MRAVIQRVKSAKVSVSSETIGEIGKGIVVLIGFAPDDAEKEMNYILEKTILLRIFEDADDKMNLSMQDIGGELLIIPNFTLYGDARKGRRPSFSSAAMPDNAKKMFDKFVELSKTYGVKVEKGEFGAEMEVLIINDGPVTVLLDSDKLL